MALHHDCSPFLGFDVPDDFDVLLHDMHAANDFDVLLYDMLPQEPISLPGQAGGEQLVLHEQGTAIGEVLVLVISERKDVNPRAPHAEDFAESKMRLDLIHCAASSATTTSSPSSLPDPAIIPSTDPL